MFQLSPIFCASVLGIASCSLAQQFPPPASYDTILQSPIDPDITISYKEPEPGTCKTAFPSQKQYTGYVNLPPYTLAPYQQNYPVNTFFWFFEARNDPESAPLTIWLNGGPGSSSMIGLFREMGPCEVVQLEDGSYATQANVWGWDRSSNLLFIDQPTQVGFSYDELVNVSRDFTGDDYITEPPTPLPEGVPSWAFANGTLASRKLANTQNSTIIAARAAWHFLQGFLSAFPQYNPGQHPDRTTIEPTGVNLFTESYGGQYGPVFADFFEDQNQRRYTGKIPASNTLEIKLTSLGIINGLVDTVVQTPSMASFVYNNSYGLQSITQTQYLNLLNEFKMKNGCQDLGAQCHARATNRDYEGENLDEETMQLCSEASDACWAVQSPIFSLSERNPYDIRVTSPSSFPSYAYLEYLNSADVLRSIGARVNFTESNRVVQSAFHLTGDEVRGTSIHKLADLLARGIRVAFIYGDADIICNWVGGEAASLAVAHDSALYSSAFPAAGYADIVSNASYIGGHVRQYGNLSFSRIFDAGHTVPSYQAETSFVVFSRIIQGDDIGMGRNVDLSTFGTQGDHESIHKNEVPPQPKSTCWIRAVEDTCTDDEQRQISDKLGVVVNGQWFPQAPTSSRPGHFNHRLGRDPPIERPTTTSSIALVGVFTATATPTPTSGASRLSFRVQPRQRRQTQLQAGDRLTTIAEQATNVKHGLIGGIAGVGALLLLLTALAAACLGWRRHRSRKHDRKFLGGPRRTPSPLPVSEPVVRTTEQPEPKRNIVQRFAQRHPMHHKEPKMTPIPHDVERPEGQPALERRATRRLSTPMEPIPEAHSPRPSEDIPERRMSEPSNEPVLVQRNARSPSPTPSAQAVEKHPKTREPSPEPVPSRQQSPPPEKPKSPIQEPEPEPEKSRAPTPEPEPKAEATPGPESIAPVQRSASLPSEDKTEEAAPPPEPAPLSEPDNSPKNKPSLLKRIRSGINKDNNALKAKAHTLF